MFLGKMGNRLVKVRAGLKGSLSSRERLITPVASSGSLSNGKHLLSRNSSQASIPVRVSSEIV